MFTTIKTVFGGIMLFGGRSLHWAFAAGLGYLVAQHFTIQITSAPPWALLAVNLLVALLALLPAIVWEESSYFTTGFLFGGYILMTYGNMLSIAFFGQGLRGPDWLIFIIGALIGMLLIGFAKEWGIMFATAATGAFLFSDVFNTDPLTQSMLTGGLFVLGGLAQVLLLRFETQTRR
ncbi:MAG: hypothetical protein Kow002_21340 [Anaerolineales bacterium]